MSELGDCRRTAVYDKRPSDQLAEWREVNKKEAEYPEWNHHGVCRFKRPRFRVGFDPKLLPPKV